MTISINSCNLVLTSENNSSLSYAHKLVMTLKRSSLKLKSKHSMLWMLRFLMVLPPDTQA
jgi:hypothetical protein